MFTVNKCSGRFSKRKLEKKKNIPTKSLIRGHRGRRSQTANNVVVLTNFAAKLSIKLITTVLKWKSNTALKRHEVITSRLDLHNMQPLVLTAENSVGVIPYFNKSVTLNYAYENK